MSIIITYVCDVSGVQGHNRQDFCNVTIAANVFDRDYYKTITKVIHKDVALKLHLIKVKEEEKQPEPTLESKLMVLLKDYIQEIAYEAGGEAGAEAASNRG